MPFADVSIVPLAPTATNWLPDQRTARSAWAVPEVCDAQDVPSEDVSTTPESPAITNFEPDHTTAFKALETPELLGVQLSVLSMGEEELPHCQIANRIRATLNNRFCFISSVTGTQLQYFVKYFLQSIKYDDKPEFNVPK